jgi:hypothetical protein
LDSGLFLFGLIVFLRDLSLIILIPVAVAVALTAAVYFITTLLPLFVTFCPYNTPLSSEILWIWRVLKQLRHCCIGSKDTWIATSHREYMIVHQDATPDRLTAGALEWLVGYCQSWETVNQAIEALSNSVLEPETWRLLARRPLINLITQRFTAIFSGMLDYSTDNLHLKDKSQIKQAALYGRVLVNLTKYQGLESTDFPNKSQITAIERGLSL